VGVPVSPQEAERKGFVHETVKGKALDLAIEIARYLSSFTPESLAYIKRLVRSATETPLAQALTRAQAVHEIVHQRRSPLSHAGL
jgi:enoyl-CoA hydratase/carnithine racemase